MLLYALEKTLNEDGTLQQPVTLGGALVERERKGLTDCCELPSLEPTLVVAAWLYRCWATGGEGLSLT